MKCTISSIVFREMLVRSLVCKVKKDFYSSEPLIRLMYNLTIQDSGAACNNAHRYLTTKPAFRRTPTSTEKHTWEIVP